MNDHVHPIFRGILQSYYEGHGIPAARTAAALDAHEDQGTDLFCRRCEEELDDLEARDGVSVCDRCIEHADATYDAMREGSS